MENFLRFLSDIRVIVGIVVIIVLLIIWFIIQKMTAGKYKRQLEALEVRYNALKSEPLSLKLTRADAISRVDPEAREKITQTKDDFEKAQANLKQIQQALADTEDEILVGKLKQAKIDISDLEASITLGEKQVSSLNNFLNSILEKETEQRDRVNEQKTRFRDLRQEAQDNATQLSYIWSTIEQDIADIEKMFSAYEEWSYANDFEKASNELDEIQNSLTALDKTIHTLPNVLNDARGVIPNMIEALRNDSIQYKAKGVYLDHLQIEKNLSIITGSLKEDLESLQNGNVAYIIAHIADYKTRIEQLSEEVKKECDCFDELQILRTDTERRIKETTSAIQYVNTEYEKIKSRVNLGNMGDEITAAATELKDILAGRQVLGNKNGKIEAPASRLISEAEAMNQSLENSYNRIKNMKDRIDSVSGDEDRAKNQLLKLQVIMNQMQIKIRKYKLPSISEQYQADMEKARTYIRTLNELIRSETLNIQLLNTTLKEAIDFIYKLYNNVNNMIATVIMVENTIVFGNRYRSTYADIDSELTRSELCFRNGEYTQALTIAIATIEKIHPGNYENMIKENAKSAA